MVLSPHLDDAALSLGASLLGWSRRAYSVLIINVFSQSRFAPLDEAEAVEAVSRLRRAEDQQFIELLGAETSVVYMEEDDAPVRRAAGASLSLSRDRVLGSEGGLIKHLAERLTPFRDADFICTPAGIGDHVDHHIVRAASERVWPLEALVYYEDQPYAALASQARIDALVEQLNLPPWVAHVGQGVEPADKRALLARYPSQFGSGLARRVIRRFKALGGERVWSASSALRSLGVDPPSAV